MRSQFFCNSDVEVVFVVVTCGAGCGFRREDVDETGRLGGDKRGDADPEAHRGGGVDGGGGGRSGQDWSSKGRIRPRGDGGGREGGIVWGGEEKGHGRPLRLAGRQRSVRPSCPRGECWSEGSRGENRGSRRVGAGEARVHVLGARAARSQLLAVLVNLWPW